MAFPHQVRGVLLEECVLKLLRAAGYRTVIATGGDPTLKPGPAGLIVAGRGTGHQIDAIADFRVGQPFSNPQRLLVEAKFYGQHRPIALPIIRNTVGVLKDVSEHFFQPDPRRPAARRYHYQAAVFAASSFTKESQAYAYAHDIYLLPLGESAFFTPVLDAIRAAVALLPLGRNNQVRGMDLTALRQWVRRELQPGLAGEGDAPVLDYEWARPILDAANAIGRALVGIIGRAFPILLTPRRGLDMGALDGITSVEVHFAAADGGRGWRLTEARSGDDLFTFDLPVELFDLYATDGILSRERAVDLKGDYLDEIQAVFAPADSVRVLTFQMDARWFETLRRGPREPESGGR